MSGKWTPGPWRVGNRFTLSGVYAANGDLVANTHGATRNYDVEALVERQGANAHLIAAAPDLYAALEAMTARMSLYSGHHDDALTAMGKAALAKARGEA